MDLTFSERSDLEPIQAAYVVIASHDTLIIIFEQIENFFKPLGEYASVPTTEAVKDIVVKIVVELLEIFAIMTKEIKQGQAGESVPDYMFPVVDSGPERSPKNFFKTSIRTGIEDALSRLNRLVVEMLDAGGTEEEKR